MSSLVGLSGKLAVLYRKLAHALYGRAALELDHIDQDRRAAGAEPLPLKRGLFSKLADRLLGRTLEKYSARYELSASQRAVLEEKLDDAAIFKTKELFEKRLGVEIAAIAGTSAVSAVLGVALGLLAAPGVGVLALSALFGSLISVGLSARKLHSNLEATAHAAIEELAKEADVSSPLAERASEDQRLRQKKALDSAAAISAKYSARYELDGVERAQLDTLLESLAVLKEKELWDKRLLPTLIAPVARGGSVAATAAAMGLVGPPTAAALVLGALAESAISGVLLYKKLDQALEGAAYAFVLGRGKAAEN